MASSTILAARSVCGHSTNRRYAIHHNIFCSDLPDSRCLNAAALGYGRFNGCRHSEQQRHISARERAGILRGNVWSSSQLHQHINVYGVCCMDRDDLIHRDEHVELKLPTGKRLWVPIANLMRETGMTREEILRASETIASLNLLYPDEN